jgi:nucleoside-diphosphate-sugar epimerase
MSVKLKKILLLGSSSFAAQGLPDRLIADGHEVFTFHRGEVGRDGACITGSVLDLCGNPGLDERFDVVVNYVVLKDCSLEENGAYINELLRFCGRCKAGHLIHISSVSVYSESVRHVVEDADVEQNPENKGSYGALKVVQDLHLQQRKNRNLRVSSVRPGFILGQGLKNPVVGMAMRLGGGLVLQLGSGKNVLPVTTRVSVNKTVARLVEMEFVGEEQVVLVADKGSPSRREWLVECCRCAGIGKMVVGLPKWVWMCAGLVGEIAARLLRKNIRPMNVVANMCREMTYDASKSELFLQLDFSCDWRAELRNAVEAGEETA